VITELMFTASYAFADDEVSQAGMAQQHEIMKDRMAKHVAAGHGMTKADMGKGGKEKMRARKYNADGMSGTPEK
jgi:hypothetical protein